MDWSRRSFDASREDATEEGEGGDICGVGERTLQEYKIGRKIEKKTRSENFKPGVHRHSIGHGG